MHLNTTINDQLIQRAMTLTGLPTETEVLETALQWLIQTRTASPITNQQSLPHRRGIIQTLLDSPLLPLDGDGTPLPRETIYDRHSN